MTDSMSVGYCSINRDQRIPPARFTYGLGCLFALQWRLRASYQDAPSQWSLGSRRPPLARQQAVAVDIDELAVDERLLAVDALLRETDFFEDAP